jgi:iron complex outermembrane receptor protein
MNYNIEKKLIVVFLLFSSQVLFAQTNNSSFSLNKFIPSQLKDTIDGKPLNEIVVLASKTKQILLHSPISIQKLNNSTLIQSASPSFFDAIENVQGVQMITPSLGFKVINTRGFTNTTNVRFTQMVDGMDIQSPHIGAPIGNALGPTDIDLKDIEIIPGVASTLFGVNSTNGLANFATLSPFDKTGLSVQQKTGFNHFNDSNSSIKPFTETNIRFAAKMNEQFGYKINLGYNKGFDWIADNKTELNPNANSSTNLLGSNNPAQDQVNVYGNESSDRKTITLQGKSYVVARTGYAEKQVADYNLLNTKGDIGLYYKFKNDAMMTYTYHFSLLNNVYQRSNRFVLKNYFVQQQALQYQSKIINAKLYSNNETSGNSYNLRSMAENIDRTYKPDAIWYSDYTNAFNRAVAGGSILAIAHQEARTTADAGRPIPGTTAFENMKTKLQQINNWDSGAALKIVARLIHAEAQIDIAEALLKAVKDKGLSSFIGFDNRTYIISPDGNYFINPIKGKTFNDINYSKTGAYLSLGQSLLSNKLQLSGAIRVDKNDYFNLKSSSRLAAVFAPASSQSFRISISEGYRYPSIFEAYSNINSGGVKRIGGLPIMSSGVYENAWLATSMSAFQASVLNDINKNGLTKSQAIIKEEKLLVKNNYGYIKPENIKSVELGYRASYFQDHLVIDLDTYYNVYHDFIAQTNVNVPKTTNVDSIPFALNDKTQYNQYRIWTNSKSVVYNYGISGGLTYKSYNGWRTGLNITYSQLEKTTNDDALEDGFNTPNWMYNIHLAKKNIIKDWSIGVSYKWQSSYYMQSFLVTGITPAYGSLDANLSKAIPVYKLNLKIGTTNLLNKYYYSYLGGPSIGGMYYLSITY